jgi:hypothetical protein
MTNIQKSGYRFQNIGFGLLIFFVSYLFFSTPTKSRLDDRVIVINNAIQENNKKIDSINRVLYDLENKMNIQFLELKSINSNEIQKRDFEKQIIELKNRLLQKQKIINTSSDK